MKSLFFAAVVAAIAFLANCADDSSFVVSPDHPAHADGPTAPILSQVTALDSAGPAIKPAPESAPRDAHAAHASSDDHAGHAHAAEAQVPPKPYPLDICLVSDEKLGEHGKPHVFVHQGQEIKLCCKMCLKDFQKDPAAHLKKLSDAKAASSGDPHQHHKH